MMRRKIMIIVECYNDKELVHRIGFPGYQVRHAYNKSKVLWQVEQKQKAIGIIDEDPFAGQSKYLREYDEKDAVGKIRLLIRKDDDGEMIIRRAIQISPRLEDWLYVLAKRNHISPEKFNIPSDPDELHNFPLKRDKNFREFLIELNRSKDDEISMLKEWINEAIN
jgi:hypothetical protein